MYRSMLYVPGSADRFLEKASERGADAIIIDLEDSVAPERKGAARRDLADSVARCGAKGADVWVRINRPLSMAVRDIEEAVRAQATGIFISKVEGADHVRLLIEVADAARREIGRESPLQAIAMIESPASVLKAEQIGRAHDRLIGLIGGGEDLATALDCEPSAETLRLPKLLIHMAAKAAERFSFGMLGTVAEYADRDLIRSMALDARRHGFDGATCVHPSVIPILNECFSAGPAELQAGRSIVEAAEAAARDGRGAFVHAGKMIDLPIVERARRLISRSERWGEK